MAASIQDIANQLKNYSQSIQRKIGNEIKASAFTIAANAKRDAPKDKGRLVQLISVKQGATVFDIEVISQADYSAYVEFGTGSGVRITPGFEAIAALARGRGIRNRNYPAVPFFYGNYVAEKVKLIKRITDIIKNG